MIWPNNIIQVLTLERGKTWFQPTMNKATGRKPCNCGMFPHNRFMIALIHTSIRGEELREKPKRMWKWNPISDNCNTNYAKSV